MILPDLDKLITKSKLIIYIEQFFILYNKKKCE